MPPTLPVRALGPAAAHPPAHPPARSLTRSLARATVLPLALTLAAALLVGCSGSGRPVAVASDGPVSGSRGGSASGTLTSAPAASSASASTADRGRAVALFFGDSNFVGGGCTPDATRDMAQIAADRLGYRAVIRGAGGTGFATGNPAYGTSDFLTQVRHGALRVSPAPALVVIEGGSNDTGQPLGPVTRRAERVLAIAQATYPSARVVLMGPINVRAGRTDVTPRVVGALGFAAKQQGVAFLDAYDWLPWQRTSGLVCSDYDHATLAGQRILGATLAARLRALGA